MAPVLVLHPRRCLVLLRSLLLQMTADPSLSAILSSEGEWGMVTTPAWYEDMAVRISQKSYYPTMIVMKYYMAGSLFILHFGRV